MKVRRISITLQILIINIVVLLAASAALGIVSMKQSREAMSELMQQRMMDIANCAAASVDGDMLEPLTAEDEGSAEYQTVFDALALYRDSVEVEYIYGVKSVGGNSFIFTVDPTIDDPAAFGDVVEYTEALGIANQGTPSVDKEPYEDEWGRFYSAYSPVFNSSHKEQETTSTNSRTHLLTLFDDINNTKASFDVIRDDAVAIQSECDTLNSSIENLSAISQKNADSASVTASSFSEITNIISTVSGRADSIMEMSDGLGKMVSKYNT